MNEATGTLNRQEWKDLYASIEKHMERVTGIPTEDTACSEIFGEFIVDTNWSYDGVTVNDAFLTSPKAVVELFEKYAIGE
jgi:hypothetical protein